MVLELKNVSVGYGKQKVIDSVSASFEKGKLTSIIGPNGCGKSTLLKSMVNILPIFDGEILADGVSLEKMSRNDTAKKISYLAQGKNIPDMTVEQMVLHGRFPYLGYPRRYRKRDKEIARSAMEKVGIGHLSDRPLYTLSGGMRQNAYIAMALAQDTDYILLDEPTTYLDIAHQLELMKILRELASSGKGIVTVMHDLPMAFEFSDEIAVIYDGKKAIQDTPSEISSSSVTETVFGVKVERLSGENKYFYK